MPENPGRMKLSFGTTFHQTHGSTYAPLRPAVAPIPTSSTDTGSAHPSVVVE
jgi:hypothetical protein